MICFYLSFDYVDLWGRDMLNEGFGGVVFVGIFIMRIIIDEWWNVELIVEFMFLFLVRLVCFSGYVVVILDV